MSQSILTTLTIIRGIVYDHYEFPTLLEKGCGDQIKDIALRELKTSALEQPLIENLLCQLFFTENNAWGKAINDEFENGFSVKVLGLVITLVSTYPSDLFDIFNFSPSFVSVWRIGKAGVLSARRRLLESIKRFSKNSCWTPQPRPQRNSLKSGG